MPDANLQLHMCSDRITEAESQPFLEVLLADYLKEGGREHATTLTET